MAQRGVNSLSAMLWSARKALLDTVKSKQQSVTLVVGNQSADLDSFISSILYAYFRSKQTGQVAVPLLNIPAQDIDIRPEFHQVMQQAGIDAKSLNTLDDLGAPPSYKTSLPPNLTKWILTDHNKMEGVLGQVYASRVIGVIDHHEDEHALPDESSASPHVIQVCGSCTSLVVREMKTLWNQLREGDSPQLNAIDSAQIAQFAMASILIDTRNLQNPDKTTPDDVEAVRYLRDKIEEAKDSNFDEQSYYVKVKEAKNDISGMPAQGVFRKDYKEWEENGIRLGTSSSVKRLEKLAKKVHKESEKDVEAWNKAARSFMDKRNVDMWLVLTSYNDDQGRHLRELALHWTRPELKQFVSQFKNQYGDELQLEDSDIKHLPSGDTQPAVRTWLQRNGAMSRKQVAPMLRRVLRGD